MWSDCGLSIGEGASLAEGLKIESLDITRQRYKYQFGRNFLSVFVNPSFSTMR